MVTCSTVKIVHLSYVKTNGRPVGGRSFFRAIGLLPIQAVLSRAGVDRSGQDSFGLIPGPARMPQHFLLGPGRFGYPLSGFDCHGMADAL
jgi:hypothetical protein